MSFSTPLRPWTYLRRRPGRVLPTASVVAAVTLLLVVVITPGNTFRSTLDADLAALDGFTVVSPSRRPNVDSALREILDLNPFAERWILVKALWLRYPMMVGEASCPLILARPEESRALLDRMRMRLVAGRFPSGSEPVIVVHEDVARARGIGIGSRIGTLADADDNIPGSFEVVGLVRGHGHIATGVIGSGVLASMLHARVPTFALVYPRRGSKLESDRYLHAARDGSDPAFQVIDAAYAKRRAERALKNLPLLIRFISIASATIVSVVVTLLALLAFRARRSEFAILLAIGQRRKRLVECLVLEHSILAVAAWIAGAAIGVATLAIYDVAALQPRGILIRVWDPPVLLASTAVPLLVVVVTGVAMARSLGRIDPVAVIQRRES